MLTRTIQFWGYTHGEVRATCQIGGLTVFDGVIDTDQLHRVLWQAQIPLDWHGNLPVQIQCSSGGMLYHDGVLANYAGTIKELIGISERWQSAHPEHVPATVMSDLNSLSDEDMMNLYGSAWPSDSDLIWNVITPSCDHYWLSNGINTAESDGKENVKLNGGSPRETLDVVQRRNDPAMMGDWGYRIWSGEMLSYDLTLIAPMDVD